MRIIVKANTIKLIHNDGETIDLDLGYIDIRDKGTGMVDQIVESVVNDINKEEIVTVIGEDNIEILMIARKIEDKIKREVETIHPMEGVEY
ncbi:MAG: hypothetical protein QM532_04290 [Cyanobium sp. MAG06]|nr:hypothetical protein [Cyanobium sp. MAG06]